MGFIKVTILSTIFQGSKSHLLTQSVSLTLYNCHVSCLNKLRHRKKNKKKLLKTPSVCSENET